jgi:hypothetical protein
MSLVVALAFEHACQAGAAHALLAGRGHQHAGSVQRLHHGLVGRHRDHATGARQHDLEGTVAGRRPHLGTEELVVQLGLGPAGGARGAEHRVHEAFRPADVDVLAGARRAQQRRDVELLRRVAVVEVEVHAVGEGRRGDAAGEGRARLRLRVA